MRKTFLALACLLAAATSVVAQERFITVASTTSTEQSGLFGHLLPLFTQKTGINVRVVALGTGQALDVGRRGDADVVFVHDKAAEEKFLSEIDAGILPVTQLGGVRPGAVAAAIFLREPNTSLLPMTFAGSAFGPTMMKSLYITS